MSNVKSIDVYAIEAKVKANPELKDVWRYIEGLKQAHKNQQELTNKAVGKVRELAAELATYKQ